MDIVETREGDVIVLEPDGSLTAAPDCQALEKKLTALLDARTLRIVVDGAKVAQIGSGAVRVLLRVTRKLAPLGGCFVLCGLRERVRLALNVSGFDRDFVIVSSREEALARAMEAAAPAARADRLRSEVLAALSAGLPALAFPGGAGKPSPAGPGAGLRGLAAKLLTLPAERARP